MSNNHLFSLDHFFISVGLDVGADFSWMSIALPNQTFVGKPFKILHSSNESLELALDLRNLSREYYDLVDDRSDYINIFQFAIDIY